MSVKASRDEHGTTFTIPAAKIAVLRSGATLPGIPKVEVWWSHDLTNRYTETLIIRQENARSVDVVELTLGQVYDLIHAAGLAIMRPK